MPIIMHNYVLQGVDARPIDIEIHSTFGKPMISMIGLADHEASVRNCEHVSSEADISD